MRARGPRSLRSALLSAGTLATLLACSGGGAQTTGANAPATGEGAPAARTTAAVVKLELVGRFDAPLFATAPPGDERRLFVVEQGGTIRVVRDGERRPGAFLDISGRVRAGGEQGLLGLAFAPDYAASGRFYVYFTRRDGRQELAEGRRVDDEHATGRLRKVLVMGDPAPNHNGGMLAFGPDGLLYVGTGDGGGANDRWGARGNAQSIASPLGKLLRIDPRASGGRAYRIPRSNPFAGRRGARGEIYSYGLRNPWRFSFDRATGDIAIGDVGQDRIEEIDFRRRGRAKGANFGWRPWEGRRRNFPDAAPHAVFPLIEKRHADGWCSITGGYVVRDPAAPALAGRYLYGDFCRGQIRSARLSGGRAHDDRSLGLPRVEQLSSFGEDARGRVYVVSLGGPVYRLAPR